MKTIPPKLLPWLARKAGIDERRAEMLWDAAQRHAARRTGAQETPDYWRVAMDRLHELIAAESLREDAASFGWRRWARLHGQLVQAPLAVIDALMLNSLRGWRTLRPLQPG